eukprot:CAMPEP_0113874722 /NCGR_PEP_ID=MMETSP0780_2-20120614/4499_1 /TAXON_ID=652834 /ORGANISM="Palpitomonas bilix" /LENGTH=440 /DNA_ID=CAMNT_0000860541 /DNA_START=60 /DNA_END=1382 /DNA_ORIENTATION=- /assembly_acc=CAM_ASM_000599
MSAQEETPLPPANVAEIPAEEEVEEVPKSNTGFEEFSVHKGEDPYERLPSDQKPLKEWKLGRRAGGGGPRTGLPTPSLFVDWDKIEREREKVGRNADDLEEGEEPRFSPFSGRLLFKGEEEPKDGQEEAELIKWTLPKNWKCEGKTVTAPAYPSPSFMGHLEVEGSFFFFFKKFYKLYGIIQDRALFLYKKPQNVKGVQETEDIYGGLSLRDRKYEEETVEGKLVIKLINDDAEDKEMRVIRCHEVDEGLRAALQSNCGPDSAEDPNLMYVEGNEGMDGDTDVWYKQASVEFKRAKYRWAEAQIARWRAMGCSEEGDYVNVLRRTISQMKAGFFRSLRDNDLIVPADNFKLRGLGHSSFYIVRRQERSDRFKRARFTPFTYQVVFPGEQMAGSESYNFVTRLMDKGFDGPVFACSDFKRLLALKTLLPAKFRPGMSSKQF